MALAEDRDRRADAPDERNRCYAERAPRRRDLVYQADYCYSPQFAACSVFLAWAARNAAAPADVTETAQRAWSSGIALPEPEPGLEQPDEEGLAQPTPEGGLFGSAGSDADAAATGSEQLDWVSASAWAEAPWDERAEIEADAFEDLDDDDDEEDDEADDEEPAPPDEAMQAPKVPAALPMRRRKRPQQPIRSRGSGEWFYADPPARDPLVTRRRGITPPILLGVLGLLVVSIVVFLLATQLGRGDGLGTAAASPSPLASTSPVATRAPATTAEPSAQPSPDAEPQRRFYRVKAGDSLSGIATRFGVKEQHLQCLNRILNKNIIQLGARYEIPPEGFSCPPGWRNATPEPGLTPLPELTPEAGSTPGS